MQINYKHVITVASTKDRVKRFNRINNEKHTDRNIQIPVYHWRGKVTALMKNTLNTLGKKNNNMLIA